MVIVSPLKYVPLPNGKWPSWVKKWDDPPSRLSEVTNSMAFFFAFSFSASWETRSIVVSVSVSLVGRCHFGKGEIFPIKICYTKRESIEREDWIEKLHILIHATLNAKKKTQDNWLLSLVKSASSPIYPNTQQEKNGRSYYINPLETCWFSPILRLLFPTHFFGHDIRLLHSPPLAQQWGVRALRLHWQNSSLRTTLIISPVRDMKHEIIVGIHGGSLFHGPIIISITGCFDNGKFQLTSWRCKVFEPKKNEVPFRAASLAGIDFGAKTTLMLCGFGGVFRKNPGRTRKIRQGFPSYFCWGSSLKMSGEVLQVHRHPMSLHLELLSHVSSFTVFGCLDACQIPSIQTKRQWFLSPSGKLT